MIVQSCYARLQRIRNHSLTSLCIISHHPFFSMFRECLFVLKKIVDACNESSSPQKVGASRQTNRYEADWSVNSKKLNCLPMNIRAFSPILLNFHTVATRRFFIFGGKSLRTIFSIFRFAGTAKTEKNIFFNGTRHLRKNCLWTYEIKMFPCICRITCVGL